KRTSNRANYAQTSRRVRIQPIHVNIKEPHFHVEWFQSFDNLGEPISAATLPRFTPLDARQRVNRMCMAAGSRSSSRVQLGTSLKYNRFSRVFRLPTPPTPKLFPVCTIRSTLSRPIHCIVWAKSYLLLCVDEWAIVTNLT
ncbi:hypothetical protein OG21DRAFT_517892, partial [Imleria badia]